MGSIVLPEGLITLWRRFTASRYRTTLLLIAGMAGILLIFLSDLWSERANTQQHTAREEENTFSSAAFIRDTEEKLSEIVGSIEGVGNVKVMVTLEQGPRYLYAQEGKTQQDRTEDVLAQGQRKVQTKDSTEQKYILVDGSGGGKQPVVTAQLEPEIKGVVIVCSGADDIRVQTRVTSVVTTALGISSARVCVVKIDQS